MIVEFIGPPASGKSTIEAEFAAQVGADSCCRWALKQRSDMIQNFGLSLLIEPHESMKLFQRILNTHQEKSLHYPYLWAYGQSLFQFIDRCPENKICVLDQGPIQYLWGIGITGADRTSVLRYVLDRIREFRRRYIVIDVQVSTNELQQRLDQRENESRVDTFHLESFERGMQLSKELSELCKTEGSIQHMVVDGEALPESNVVEILDTLPISK